MDFCCSRMAISGPSLPLFFLPGGSGGGGGGEKRPKKLSGSGCSIQLEPPYQLPAVGGVGGKWGGGNEEFKK